MSNLTDCISRQAVIDLMMQKWGENFSGDDAMQESIDAIRVMPSVTPQLTSELEKNSKKLDCISRADALDCVNWGYSFSDIYKKINELPPVTPQEPFKPMVEIDLYSVIKQKYIEREVLDKIREEIERQEKWLMDAGYNQYNVDIALDTIKSVVDKYKAETEAE